jgi:hypothetical protein
VEQALPPTVVVGTESSVCAPAKGHMTAHPTGPLHVSDCWALRHRNHFLGGLSSS